MKEVYIVKYEEADEQKISTIQKPEKLLTFHHNSTELLFRAEQFEQAKRLMNTYLNQKFSE